MLGGTRPRHVDANPQILDSESPLLRSSLGRRPARRGYDNRVRPPCSGLTRVRLATRYSTSRYCSRRVNLSVPFLSSTSRAPQRARLARGADLTTDSCCPAAPRRWPLSSGEGCNRYDSSSGPVGVAVLGLVAAPPRARPDREPRAARARGGGWTPEQAAGAMMGWRRRSHGCGLRRWVSEAAAGGVVSEDGRDFFVSYTAVNQPWAGGSLCSWSGPATRRCAGLDFRPGQRFRARMQQAVTSAARTIAVLSPAYFGSRFGEAEWRAAFAADPTGELGCWSRCGCSRANRRGCWPAGCTSTWSTWTRPPPGSGCWPGSSPGDRPDTAPFPGAPRRG